ncbi:hypothetical protein J6590_022799 [Homalodisca vitripennis]|nr:hypothetical protein J6590_022799 [Homalodisca vitripennis]
MDGWLEVREVLSRWTDRPQGGASSHKRLQAAWPSLFHVALTILHDSRRMSQCRQECCPCRVTILTKRSLGYHYVAVANPLFTVKVPPALV